VELEKIDVVGLQAAERFLDLAAAAHFFPLGGFGRSILVL